jgi:hypothetical protein
MDDLEVEALAELVVWHTRLRGQRTPVPSLAPILATIESLTRIREPMAGEVAVYALLDPRTFVARYIGITGNTVLRLKQHLHSAVNEYKKAWVEELKQAGLVPVMQVLQIVPPGVAPGVIERVWIEFYVHKLGVDLINLKDVPLVPADTKEESSFSPEEIAFIRQQVIGGESRQVIFDAIRNQRRTQHQGLSNRHWTEFKEICEAIEEEWVEKPVELPILPPLPLKDPAQRKR